MQCCALVLAQVLNERDVFCGVKGELCPIHLSRASSGWGDGTKLLFGNLVHLCVYLYVCNCMEKNLYLSETPMYSRYNYYMIVILLLEVSQGKLNMSLKCGQNIWSIKGSPKWDFHLFWWVQTFWLLLFDMCCSLGPVLVIWYVILSIFS